MFPSWRIAILLFSAGCLVLAASSEIRCPARKGDGPTRDMGSGPQPRSGGSNIDNLPLILDFELLPSQNFSTDLRMYAVSSASSWRVFVYSIFVPENLIGLQREGCCAGRVGKL